MGRLHSGQFLWFVLAIVLFLESCGGSKPPGVSPFPTRITLNPATSASLQQGSILGFTATAQNGAGANVSPGFVFASDNPNVLTFSPNGVACGGTWNAPLYTECTPAGVGVANVTASALGATSPPTMVFVHAPIDNVQIEFVQPVNPPPPACPTQTALPAACNIPFNPPLHPGCTYIPNPPNPPTLSCTCLSQNQVSTLQATAYSQGTDITASVGPFTWSEGTTGVVTVTRTIDLTTKIATNQATATPGTPGETQITATASGVSSQPYPFETCPVQCIALEVGKNGSQQTGETSFIVNKGTSETVTATAVDVQGCALAKPPLTWTSSQPGSLVAGSATTGCAAGTTCSVTTPQAGAASITASCTPPTCNVGFPLNPLNLSAPYIPQPVYPVTPISGLVNSATSTAPTFNVLATSLDCTGNPFCSVALYNIASTKNVAGSAIQLPEPPNSLILDPGGDKVYIGSQYGAALVTASSLGSANTTFTNLPASATPTGKVTGKVLATSPNGSIAVFSDTISTPNQVYVVNTTSATPSTTPLNIFGATTAAFSPDGSKGFILGCAPGQTVCPNNVNTLYVYSTLQALQTIALGPSVNATAIAFSSSGAFAFINEGTLGSAGTIAVRNVCDNNPTLTSTSVPLTIPTAVTPIALRTIPPAVLPISVPNMPVLDGINVLMGIDTTNTDTGLDIIVTTATAAPLTALCPQSGDMPAGFIFGTPTVTNPPTVPNPYRISFGQGALHPINFFLSPDGTQVFLVASDRSSVLVYSFNTSSVSAIPLANSITGQTVFPVSAGITTDGTLIYVATSDGTLHQISTASGASADLTQIGFAPIPNSTNGFCVNGIAPVPCTLNLVAVRP